MVIEGYVYDRIEVNEKVIQIIIKKKYKEIYLFNAFISFGWIKDLIIEQDIRQKDKVRIEYHIKSKKWNDRYLTELIIDKIDIKERRNNQTFVDFETGEIIE